ncbi:MAG TPA: Glu/Leu/Phe/Val dehydrogenase dimerization domain-containing protein [Pirellulaceae bacterium]|nr:Glu/Leu/Phe/Val dehydrogenase dimerization domain-containing protein [Pirellulaceae bacterium]HMO93963.1 Glu/Leu/Phe/Val dehydrogenase dimerization domain-containing protein [Pirellulaceae bacterium]HMP67969.1 Glu/Leu/Phe/Val dehydrogenase dimerization domain-containing protein [Pirellulaceae bacterium]
MISNNLAETFDQLVNMGIHRFCVAAKAGGLVCTHPQLQDLAKQIAELPDFDNHEGVFVEVNAELGVIFAACVHSTTRGQAQGGVRLLDHEHYGTLQSLITDGLRLSRGMTEKNAGAGLWWGGGKGIICPIRHTVPHYKVESGKSRPSHRTELFEAYGQFIASLKGVYITAEDMNTSPWDMKDIHRECRFVTCLPPEMGGSSNPSRFTAQGVFVSMLAGLQHLHGSSDTPLQGRTVLIQGIGNVGRPLLDMVINAKGKAIVFEINQDACDSARKAHGTSTLEFYHDMNDLLGFMSLEGDVFSPNAGGAVISAENYRFLKVPLIAGAANNQLTTPDVAKLLHAQGTLYLPDFLINCMGIVNCANEQYGYSAAKIREEVAKLQTRVEELLRRKGDGDLFDLAASDASTRAQETHPLWPGHGQELLDSILDDWHKSSNSNGPRSPR